MEANVIVNHLNTNKYPAEYKQTQILLNHD